MINGSYDPWLVVMSCLIAILAAYATLNLMERVSNTGTSSKRHWLLVGAIIMGAGIWSMHFVGMLAFNLPMSITYDLPITLLSLLMAITASWCALFITRAGNSDQKCTKCIFGGSVLGAGIAAMHYTGMAAMQMAASISYRMDLLLLSVVVAIIASIAALRLAFHLEQSNDDNKSWYKIGIAVVIGFAIIGMHYLGMAAANFYPDNKTINGYGLELQNLAIIIATVSIVLLFGIVAQTSWQRDTGFGIKTKISLLTFTLVIISAGTIGFVSYNYINSILLQQEAEKLNSEITTESARIGGLIETLRQDVLFLSNTPPIQGIARASLAKGIDSLDNSTHTEWEGRLEKIFESFLNSRPYYIQVRYLGISDNGRELVNAKRNEDNVAVIIPRDKLQRKGSTDYFKETISRESGDIYLSRIELNREHGEISSPPTPVLRAATPIYGPNNKVFGIVIINLNFGKVLHEIATHYQFGLMHEFDLRYITNSHGDFLYHPEDSSLAFSFEYGKTVRMQDLYPIFNPFYEKEGLLTDVHSDEIRNNAKQKNTASTKNRLMSLHKLYFDPSDPERYLVFGEAAPHHAIMSRTSPIINSITTITFILIAIAAFLTVLFSELITRPLKTLSNATKVFASGRTKVILPEKSNDEIGILSNNFSDMMDQVQQRTDALEKSEDFVSKVIDNAAEGIITINRLGIIHSFNNAAETIFDIRAENIIGENISTLMPEPTKSQHDSYLEQFKSGNPENSVGKIRLVTAQRKNGETFPMELTITKMKLDNEIGFIGMVRDVSKQQQSAQKLRLSEKVIETSLEGVIITDKLNRVISVNPAFTDITGYSEKEILGKDPNIMKSGRHNDNFYSEMWQELNISGCWQGEIWDRRKSGEIHPKWMSISTIKGADGTIEKYIGIFSDITERKIVQSRLEHMAHYDPLTNLPNRLLYIDRLQQSIDRAKRNHSQTALFFLDLDRFKVINDTLGHNTGDLLLMEVAHRLQEGLRSVDTIARLGGDEFTVILDDVQSEKDIDHISNNIISLLSKPYNIDGHECFIGVSIGISIYPDNGENAQTLAKHADMAMYRAKERGTNNYQLFDPLMSQNMTRRLELETSIRRALQKNEFKLFYQPQLNVSTGQIMSVEALIRWRTPNNEYLPPSEFIPVAEDTGLINDIGTWVLEEACIQHKKWRENTDCKDLHIAVNVSANQLLQNSFPEMIAALLKKHDMQHQHLGIEITESTLMTDPKHAIQVLNEIHAMGIELSIDDFGTGFSSLSYLKQLPIQHLKIDRSFIHEVTMDIDDANIVKATISMAHNMGLIVVAEGVETTEQMDFLIQHKCDLLQGYLFSKPITADEFIHLYEANSRDNESYLYSQINHTNS